MNPARIRFPKFDDLDPDRRRMLGELDAAGDGRAVYDRLDPKERAAFLNITGALRANGYSTAELHLRPLDGSHDRGIQSDRLMFTASSSEPLRRRLERSLARDEFAASRPEDKLHPGMSDWGGRELSTTMSMQVGGGKNGAFVDIDEFGVQTDVVGALGHGFEVIRNSLLHRKTDPFKVGHALRERGVDVGWSEASPAPVRAGETVTGKVSRDLSDKHMVVIETADHELRAIPRAAFAALPKANDSELRVTLRDDGRATWAVQAPARETGMAR